MSKETTCPICNKLFTIPPTRPKQKYCSRECSVIGRRTSKEDQARNRVETFIETLPDLPILNVLEGKIGSGTDNRMTVTGARMWDTERFIVLVVKRD